MKVKEKSIFDDGKILNAKVLEPVALDFSAYCKSIGVSITTTFAWVIRDLAQSGKFIPKTIEDVIISRNLKRDEDTKQRSLYGKISRRDSGLIKQFMRQTGEGGDDRAVFLSALLILVMDRGTPLTNPGTYTVVSKPSTSTSVLRDKEGNRFILSKKLIPEDYDTIGSVLESRGGKLYGTASILGKDYLEMVSGFQKGRYESTSSSV